MESITKRMLSRIGFPKTLLSMSSTTYNHRKGQTFRAAMIRSAEKRQCPKCKRKSAVVTNPWGDRVCRWDCGYASLSIDNQ